MLPNLALFHIEAENERNLKTSSYLLISEKTTRVHQLVYFQSQSTEMPWRATSLFKLEGSIEASEADTQAELVELEDVNISGMK